MTQSSGGEICVLHVDDDPDFGAMVADFLEREDDRFVIETVTSASEGNDRLAEDEYDCVVSDYDMPGQTGIEFLETVREENPDLPFILFTGKGSEEVASEAISAGTTDYLQKQSGSEQYQLLANRVRNAVSQFRSARRAAELDRIRTLASDINQALVRAESRLQAETRVCEIISESDPYLFAWIGEVDPETERVEPRTSAGIEEDYLDQITVTANESPTGRGPGGTAIRERRVAVSQDIAEDAEFEPWREEALDRGYRAVAAVPLEYQDTIYGLLSVYAERPDAFDEDERELLAELGNDIGHAIHSFEIGDRLREERDHRRALFENAPGPVIAGETVEGGATELITDVNEAFEDVFGYEADDILGRDIAEVVVPEDEMDQHETFRMQAKKGESTVAEVERMTADGPRDFLLHIIPYVIGNESRRGWYAWYTDISDRLAREQAIEELHHTTHELMAAESSTEVAEITVASVRDILGMAANGIHLYDEKCDGLVPAAWTAETEAVVGVPPTFARGEGIAGKAYETGEPYIYGDVSAVPERFNPNTDVRSQIVLPLDDHGVLVIGSPESGAFDDTDVSLAQTLVGHATAALDRIEREQQLHLMDRLVQEMNDGAVIVQDGEIEYTNPRVSDLLGYPDGELVGMPMGEFIAPEYRETVRQRHQQRIAGDDDDLPEMYEIELVSSDGENIPVEINVTRIEYGGEPATLSLVRNITERRNQDRKREQIIDRVTDAIVEVGPDWQFTLVNEHAEELYDMDEEKLLGRDFWDVFAEARGTRFEEVYRGVMETRDSASFTEYYDELDGWFDIDVYPKDDGGLAFYFRNVTDRIERSHELERRSDRFQYIEAVANIGYWEIDTRTPEPHDVTLSDGVYHIHDLSPDERLDVEKGLRFYHPEDRPTVERAVERAISEGEPYDHEVRLITDSGRERWVHSVGEPIERDGAVVKVRGVFQDVTDRKRQEQELHRQNERLDEFASIVSHDLRNPLNIVEGRLELASQDCDSEHLVRAEGALGRCQALIDNLLTLAREGDRADDIESVSLPTVLQSCWQNVETADATLLTETDRTVRADPSRLKQLLENLLRNAIEHGGEDVTITVGDLSNGFYVADDGPGIPEDDREQVFEVGYSTATDGTGFGLNIVRKIAEAHGWEIKITDNEDGGARFEITGVEIDR